MRSKWGNVITKAVIGGQPYTFRSKLEFRWAKYLQFLKDGGVIKEWEFESRACRFYFPNEKTAPVNYLIDFRTVWDTGDIYYECKGHLTGKDNSKFKRMKKHHPEFNLVLVFANKPKASRRLDIARKYVDGILYANSIFRKVGFMKGLK